MTTVTHVVVAASLALLAAAGVHLLVGALLLGRHSHLSLRILPVAVRRPTRDLLEEFGVSQWHWSQILVVEASAVTSGALLGWMVFGGSVPAIVLGVTAACVPPASARGRVRRIREMSRDAWPRMLEELRLAVVQLGRSVPQALLDIGERAPRELQPAFAAARREWLISTDLSRALAVLRRQLADPTADVVCETLLIAHEVGGSDIDVRLRTLIGDRLRDIEHRREARAKQAGVRFARIFVLLVPFGMALVGLLIGDGRAAYATPTGQLAVVVALGCMAACWAWAGRLLRLPEERRVFDAARGDA